MTIDYPTFLEGKKDIFLKIQLNMAVLRGIFIESLKHLHYLYAASQGLNLFFLWYSMIVYKRGTGIPTSVLVPFCKFRVTVPLQQPLRAKDILRKKTFAGTTTCFRKTRGHSVVEKIFAFLRRNIRAESFPSIAL